MIEQKIDELIEAINQLTAAMGATVDTEKTEKPAPKKRAPSKKKADADPAETPETKTEAAEPVKTEEPAEEDPADDEINLDGVRSALTAFNGKHGLQATRDLLSGYGVQKVSELQPEQYADVFAEIQGKL